MGGDEIEASGVMGEARAKRQRGAIEMQGLIGARSCRSCEYRGKFENAPGILFCRRFPPQVYAIPGNTPQGVQWMMNATYPTVNPDLPCGEYSRSAPFAAEELAESVKGLVAQ